MPEGPSIVIAAEAAEIFKGKTIASVSGNTSIDKGRLVNNKVTDVRSWGKHFLICFKDFTLRIHFLLFGSYLVNEEKDAKPRLSMVFKNGVLNLYSCSIKILEGSPDDHYDWTADVMNDKWDRKQALQKLKAMEKTMVCDALLDQDVFAGVGNIIKNEVLFRVRVHPESLVDKIPAPVLSKIVTEARTYSFEFLEWKKAFTLKAHWKAHTKTICPRCDLPFVKKYAGKTKRRSFFCTNCQVLYK